MVRACRTLLLLVLAIGAAPCALGITIDDFSQGAFSQTGSSNLVSQTDLHPTHVVGGRRDFGFGQFGPPDTVEIDTQSGMFSFSSESNYGYLTLMYGMGGPLGQDFTQGGHDRLRFYFTDVVSRNPHASWLSINSELPPRSSTLVELRDGMNALDGGGGILEVPFQTFGQDFTNVNTFAIDIARFPAGSSFVLDAITTAAPPIVGDYNRDGMVDLADYLQWRRFFGKSTRQGVLLTADGNMDGRVDSADYLIWRAGLGRQQTGSQPAPEPTAAALVISAVAAITFNSLRAARNPTPDTF